MSCCTLELVRMEMQFRRVRSYAPPDSPRTINFEVRAWTASE